MAYINCEQYHIDNNTRHIFIKKKLKKKKKHAMKNTNISIKRNEKKKRP